MKRNKSHHARQPILPLFLANYEAWRSPWSLFYHLQILALFCTSPQVLMAVRLQEALLGAESTAASVIVRTRLRNTKMGVRSELHRYGVYRTRSASFKHYHCKPEVFRLKQLFDKRQRGETKRGIYIGSDSI